MNTPEPEPSTTPAPSAITKAVIPAAGLGTRLRPLTRAFPKELLPVGREPVLSYIATELREAGITQALFIVSNGKPQIRQFFGEVYEGERPDLPALHCAYVTQTEQRGSGDALLYAQDWVADTPFVVAFGDCIIEGRDKREKIKDERADAEAGAGEIQNQQSKSFPKIQNGNATSPLQRLMETHSETGAEATVLVEAVAWEKVSRYGVVAPRETVRETPDAAFALADIVEKPPVENAPSRLVVAARWALQPSIFPVLRQTALDARGERNITDAVRVLLQSGMPAWAVPLLPGEARRDIGNLESYFAQFVRAALRDAEFGATARKIAQEELSR